MSLPQSKYVEIPLLREIAQAGGSCNPGKPLWHKIGAYFRGLKRTDLKSFANSNRSKWAIRINFVARNLSKKGEIDKSKKSVWEITDKGIERLSQEWPKWWL